LTFDGDAEPHFLFGLYSKKVRRVCGRLLRLGTEVH
jgi:hypothetical protein